MFIANNDATVAKQLLVAYGQALFTPWLTSKGQTMRIDRYRAHRVRGPLSPWKRLLSLGLLLLMVASCSSNGGDDLAGTPDGTGDVEDSDRVDDAGGTEGAADTEAAAEEVCVAAEDEPTLIWYTAHIPDLVEETIAAFESAYPDVDMDYLRLASGELAARYSEERSAGADPAGIINLVNPAFFEEGLENDWFEDELDLPALQAWPDDFKLEESLPVISVDPYLVGYNSDRVPEGDVPQAWPDLLDPKFEGAILWGDTKDGSPGFLALAQILREEFGDDFLSGLADQDIRTVASLVPGSEELAAGGAALMVPQVNILHEPLVENGAPVGITLLEPTTGSEHVAAVTTENESPNSARCFMNFLLTEEGHSTFVGTAGVNLLGVGDNPVPDGYVSPDFDAANEEREEILDLLGLN